MNKKKIQTREQHISWQSTNTTIKTMCPYNNDVGVIIKKGGSWSNCLYKMAVEKSQHSLRNMYYDNACI